MIVKFCLNNLEDDPPIEPSSVPIPACCTGSSLSWLISFIMLFLSLQENTHLAVARTGWLRCKCRQSNWQYQQICYTRLWNRHYCCGKCFSMVNVTKHLKRSIKTMLSAEPGSSIALSRFEEMISVQCDWAKLSWCRVHGYRSSFWCVQ